MISQEKTMRSACQEPGPASVSSFLKWPLSVILGVPHARCPPPPLRLPAYALQPSSRRLCSASDASPRCRWCGASLHTKTSAAPRRHLLGVFRTSRSAPFQYTVCCYGNQGHCASVLFPYVSFLTRICTTYSLKTAHIACLKFLSFVQTCHFGEFLGRSLCMQITDSSPPNK